jgi:Family of unknown function (DUF6350)
VNRRLTFAIGAIQALTAVVIGVGAIAVPLSILWIFEQDAQTGWLVAFRTAADVWLLSQGTPIEIASGKFLSLDVPAFAITLIPLGYSIVLGWLAYRIGRRFSGAPEIWPAWVSALAAYALLSFLISSAAADKTAMPNQVLGIVFPTLFFAVFMTAGAVLGEPRAVYGVPKSAQASDRKAFKDFFSNQFQKLPWVIRVVWSPALRAGTGIVLALLVISSVLIALLTAFNWINVVTFYESVHATWLGGFALTVGQIALLPNLVIYGASWLTGVGFSIGAGSLISPLGTAAGPLPAIPILSILPQGQLGFGMVAIVVPLVLAFFATLAIRNHAEDVRFEFATPLASALALGLSIAFVAAAELAILAWLASGGFGPGRLATNGANPLWVFAISFVEVAAVSVLASFYSARPNAADHPLLSLSRKK